jgi:hypothetical protein
MNYNNSNNSNLSNIEYTDEEIEKCLSIIKEKMNIAAKIYRFLYMKESSINNGSNNSSYLLNNLNNYPLGQNRYYMDLTNKQINNNSYLKYCFFY